MTRIELAGAGLSIRWLRVRAPSASLGRCASTVFCVIIGGVIVSDDEVRQRVAANLRRLRKETGLSLSELGRRCSTSAGAIRDVERGERMPGAGMLTRLAEALGVGIVEMLADRSAADQKAAARA